MNRGTNKGVNSMVTFTKWETVDVQVDVEVDSEDLIDELENDGYLVLGPAEAKIYDLITNLELDLIGLRAMGDRLRDMEFQDGKYDSTLRGLISLVDILEEVL
jgi:hypothetical protein